MKLDHRTAIGVLAACLAALVAYRVFTPLQPQLKEGSRTAPAESQAEVVSLAPVAVPSTLGAVKPAAEPAGPTRALPPPDPVAVPTESMPNPLPDAEVTRYVAALQPGHPLPVRLQALDQLKLLGRQGDNDGRIHASLEAAMGDPDPQVAVNARDAISELLN